MKNVLVLVSLSVVLPVTACSTMASHPVQYRIAEVAAESASDAVAGLAPIQQEEYRTLYYHSPGMRRLGNGNY